MFETLCSYHIILQGPDFSLPQMIKSQWLSLWNVDIVNSKYASKNLFFFSFLYDYSFWFVFSFLYQLYRLRTRVWILNSIVVFLFWFTDLFFFIIFSFMMHVCHLLFFSFYYYVFSCMEEGSSNFLSSSWLSSWI